MIKKTNIKLVTLAATFAILSSMFSGNYQFSAVQSVDAANPSTVFNYTGSLQTYPVPASGIYQIESYGAQGSGNGGLGGKAVATFSLRAGDALQIEVGGQNGYNGGGVGSSVGGGSTTVNLAGVNLLTAAGGGGGSGGSMGGNDTGLGGASVGSGSGGNGTNGAGGGRSFNYSYDNGYYEDVYETRTERYSYQTDEYYSFEEPVYGQIVVGTWQSCVKWSWETGEGPGNERCVKYETSNAYDWGITGYKTVSGYRTVTEHAYRDVQYKVGTRWVKTGTTTVQGLPGKGGSNMIHTNGTDKTLASGIQAGNGQVVITSLDTEPPEIELTPHTTDRTNSSITVKAKITDKVSEVAEKKWEKGNRSISYFSSGGKQLSDSFLADANGLYTVFAKDSIGNQAIETITISNINYAPVLNISSIDKQLAAANDIIKVTGTISDEDNDKVFIKATLGGAEATTVVSNGNGSWELSFKGSEIEEGTYTSITVTADDTYDVVSKSFSFPTLTVDNTMPFFWAVTYTPKATTKGDVTIQVNIGDTNSGVKKLTRPDGTTTSKLNSTYLVKENGKYDFTVEDKAGNAYTHTVDVTNIDKEYPELMALTLHQTNNKTFEVTVKAMDASGIEKVTLDSGEVLQKDKDKGAFFITNISNLPKFVLLEDKLGNVSGENEFLELPLINLDNYDLQKVQKEDMKGFIDGSHSISYKIGTKTYDCTKKPCVITITKNTNVTALNQNDKKASLKTISIETIDKSVDKVIPGAGAEETKLPSDLGGDTIKNKPIENMVSIDKESYAEKTLAGETYYINFQKSVTDKKLPVPGVLLNQ